MESSHIILVSGAGFADIIRYERKKANLQKKAEFLSCFRPFAFKETFIGDIWPKGES